MKKYFFTLLSAFVISGCQTSPLKDFDSLKPGMEKADVLDIMGSPNATYRRQGKDRWLYVFYDKQIRFEKELQFFEGTMVYKGDYSQGIGDQEASAVDARNAIGTREGKEQVKKDYQKYVEENSKVKPSTATEADSVNSVYAPAGSSENSVSKEQPAVKPAATPTDKSKTDVKYVPKFESVQ